MAISDKASNFLKKGTTSTEAKAISDKAKKFLDKTKETTSSDFKIGGVSLGEQIKSAASGTVNTLSDIAKSVVAYGLSRASNINTILESASDVTGYVTGIDTKAVSDYFEQSAKGLNIVAAELDADVKDKTVGWLTNIAANVTEMAAGGALLKGVSTSSKLSKGAVGLGELFYFGSADYAEQYQGMKDTGQNPLLAASVATSRALAVGKLEKVAVDSWFQSKFGSGIVAQTVSNLFTNGAQEVVQQGVGNTYEKIAYNANRELTDGLIEAGLGGLVGGAYGTALGATMNKVAENNLKKKAEAVFKENGATVEQAKQLAATYVASVNSAITASADNISKAVREQYLSSVKAHQEANEKTREVSYDDGMVKVETAENADKTFTAFATVKVKDGTVDMGEYSAQLEGVANSREEALRKVSVQMQDIVTKSVSSFAKTDQAVAKAMVSTNKKLKNIAGIETQMEFVANNQELIQEAKDLTEMEFVSLQKNLTTEEEARRFWQKANAPQTELITQENVKKLTDAYAKTLGVSTKMVQRLTTDEGQEALGSYESELNKILLNTGYQEGGKIDLSTVYHELGHSFFNTVLSDKEKRVVLDQLKKKHGDISDAELEERLVNDIKTMMGKKRTGFIGKFMDLIDRVVEFLKGDKVSKFYREFAANKRISKRTGKMEAKYAEKENYQLPFQSGDDFVPVAPAVIETEDGKAVLSEMDDTTGWAKEFTPSVVARVTEHLENGTVPPPSAKKQRELYEAYKEKVFESMTKDKTLEILEKPFWDTNEYTKAEAYKVLSKYRPLILDPTTAEMFTEEQKAKFAELEKKYPKVEAQDTEIFPQPKEDITVEEGVKVLKEYIVAHEEVERVRNAVELARKMQVKGIKKQIREVTGMEKQEKTIQMTPKDALKYSIRQFRRGYGEGRKDVSRFYRGALAQENARMDNLKRTLLADSKRELALDRLKNVIKGRVKNEEEVKKITDKFNSKISRAKAEKKYNELKDWFNNQSKKTVKAKIDPATYRALKDIFTREPSRDVSPYREAVMKNVPKEVYAAIEKTIPKEVTIREYKSAVKAAVSPKQYEVIRKDFPKAEELNAINQEIQRLVAEGRLKSGLWEAERKKEMDELTARVVEKATPMSGDYALAEMWKSQNLWAVTSNMSGDTYDIVGNNILTRMLVDAEQVSSDLVLQGLHMDIMPAWAEALGMDINEVTREEWAYITMLSFEYMGDEFSANRVVEDWGKEFGFDRNTIKYKKIKRSNALELLKASHSIREDKYKVTDLVTEAHEKSTGKVFNTTPNYLHKRGWVFLTDDEIIKNGLTAEDVTVDPISRENRDTYIEPAPEVGKTVAGTRTKVEQSFLMGKSEDVPNNRKIRVDFPHLFIESFDDHINYAFMQPVLDKINYVIGQSSYRMKSAKEGRATNKSIAVWKDRMDIVAKRGKRYTTDDAVRLMRGIKNNVTTSILGLKASSAFIQLQSVWMAVGTLMVENPKAALNLAAEAYYEIGKMMLNRGYKQGILEDSAALRNRLGTLADASTLSQASIFRLGYNWEELSPWQKLTTWTSENINEKALAGLKLLDSYSATAVVASVRRTLIEQGVEPEEALRKAEIIMQISQGGNSFATMPSMLTKGAGTGMLFTLSSFALSAQAAVYQGIFRNGIVRGIVNPDEPERLNKIIGGVLGMAVVLASTAFFNAFGASLAESFATGKKFEDVFAEKLAKNFTPLNLAISSSTFLPFIGLFTYSLSNYNNVSTAAMDIFGDAAEAYEKFFRDMGKYGFSAETLISGANALLTTAGIVVGTPAVEPKNLIKGLKARKENAAEYKLQEDIDNFTFTNTAEGKAALNKAAREAAKKVVEIEPDKNENEQRVKFIKAVGIKYDPRYESLSDESLSTDERASILHELRGTMTEEEFNTFVHTGNKAGDSDFGFYTISKQVIDKEKKL